MISLQTNTDSKSTFIISAVLYLTVLTTTVRTEFLKSHKITEVGENWDSNHAHRLKHNRVKRWFWPTETQKQLLLDLHNDNRRKEGASNMEFMTWNNVLSDMAGAWGDLCRWEHGQPTGFNPPYSSLGQNLYIISVNTQPHRTVMVDGMRGWYDDEKPFWDFETSFCTPGEQCGHYTQVVWAESIEVGCAISNCVEPPLNLPAHFANSSYLVCNYGPPGNIQNATGVLHKAYKVGPACTECSSGQFWCDNGLCRSKASCDSAGVSCECKANCKNCGTVDQNTCSCSCSKGFTGVDCSEPCQDNHEWCGANPGWPISWCNNTNYPYVNANCPKFCKLCQPLAANESPVTCGSTTTTSTTTTTTKPTTTTSTTTTTMKPTTTTSTTTTTKPTTITTTTTKPTTTTTMKPTTTSTTTTTMKPTTTSTTTTTMKPTTTTSTTTTTKPTTTSTTTTTMKPTTTTSTTTTTKPTTTSTTTTTMKPTTTTSTTTTTKPTTSTTTTTKSTTTTSTTTTTKPTTTQPTTTQVDCSGYCLNGAATTVNNNVCECTCTAEWQGTKCDESRAEVRVGMKITLYAPKSIWDIIYQPVLVPVIVRGVNNYCIGHVDVCCPGATLKLSSNNYAFVDENDIMVGQGYPKESRIFNRWKTEALIYAHGSPNNELCANSVNVNRRRRSLPDMTLPQDALMEIFDSIADNITQLAMDCCNATYEVQRGQEVIPTTTPTPTVKSKKFLGLDLWIWVVIGIGGGALIFIVLSIAVCCCCIKKSKKNSGEKYRATTEAGYDNNAYTRQYTRQY